MSESAIPSAPAGGRPLIDLGSPWTVAAIVIALTVVRLVAAATIGLTEDEAYYRLWALAPALGYYDHPPMVGWWIAAGQALFGDTTLGIRFVTVLAVAVGSVAIWRAGWLLSGDRRTAGRAVVWFNATLLVGIGAMIATPDVPSAFFWGLAIWALLELVRSDDGRWWLAVGLFAGLGLLAKYSGLFLGAGIVLWLLAVPGQRKWLASPWLWIGGILAVVLALPVVYWNAQNEWVSFAKQFGRVAGDHLVLKFIPEFVLAELGLIGPLMIPFLIMGMIAIARSPRRENPGRWLVLLSGMPFLAYLLVHGLHDRVQGNWPAPLYPAIALISAEAATLAGVSERRRRGWERLRALVAPVGIGLTLLAIVHAGMTAGFVTDRDPTKQLRGWEELAGEVEALREETGAAWVGTIHYTTTGEFSFYLPETTPVFGLVEPLRYANLPAPDLALLQKPGLVLDESRRLGVWHLDRRFENFEKIATLVREANGVAIARYDVWLVSDPKGDPTGRAE
ncbi:ArnT family glycosyltransferase [Amorphus orientalis]|uniref:4-amino-4-deoxy-L-arabinose transferase-like glycosyltransferase n=1 Tax=Amorphus orientalis TaxID=649198 RepID=A0AAE3VQQ0_9HYPH|nr:glycosyltransferase family 39 protein [Amorphus orientalis]MDQ0316579.1 4-amino-4-deoxy-L-arabinose transferase-like glycosyltransferase [Amorphus orientalis]